MTIDDEIRARIQDKRKELRDNKNKQVIQKIEQAQAKKEEEFRTIAKGIDTRLSLIEEAIQELELKIEEFSNYKRATTHNDYSTPTTKD